MQFQKGQQKVPTIRKTTGLCPSRCYFRSIAFAVSEDALCFSHVGDEARETVSMVAATPAYYPPSAASVEPVSRRPRPPSLPDRPADIGGPPQLLPRNHNSSSSSSSVPPVGSSYMAANNGIVVPPSSSSSSSSAASYGGQPHHKSNIVHKKAWFSKKGPCRGSGSLVARHPNHWARLAHRNRHS